MLPAFCSPHKTETLFNAAVRLASVYEFVRFYQSTIELAVDSTEIMLDKSSYTIETLKSICKSDERYYWLMGEDSFYSFDQYHEYQTILDYVDLLVFSRDSNLKKDKDAFLTKTKIDPEKVHFMSMEKVPVSSTDIKTNITNHRSILSTVPKPVFEVLKNIIL